MAECFDPGDDWWYLVSQMSKSTSMATAVAFTALCFAYMGRIRPIPLARLSKPCAATTGFKVRPE